MKAGDLKLAYFAGQNHPVVLLVKVFGGWIVRMTKGTAIVGPIPEGPATLR